MIRIEHLCKEYAGVTPLKDVNAVVEKGDVISIIGPSGTGKSTLLRCLNQLEKPSGGRVWLGEECITDAGCNIASVRQRMGMVFQSFNLYESLKVVENVMVGPVRLKGMGRQEAYERAMDLLEQVGLADKALNYPDELSGGQKQRVAIARAIAMEPEVLLLDEPTSALDPKMVGEVQRVIADLARSGMTMMIVTHEMNFAKNISTRIFYMDEGVIYEEGTPEQVFDHPQRQKTREFVRRLSMLDVDLRAGDIDAAALAGEILGFARRNILSYKATNRLSLIVEELVGGILDDALPVGTGLNMRVEYSQTDQLVEMEVSWKGEAFDPLEDGDDISAAIVRGLIDESSCCHEDGVNRFRLRSSLKKKRV